MVLNGSTLLSSLLMLSQTLKRPLSLDLSMSEVVYAIRISHLEYSGLKIMDIKIGKSTDIDNTLRQYSQGNRDIELLDMWAPNPDKTLSTAERGVHAVAEKYAYDKLNEKFVSGVALS